MTKTNGYLLADTNSIIYAYKAGGTNLLGGYMATAKAKNLEFAITDQVEKELGSTYGAHMEILSKIGSRAII